MTIRRLSVLTLLIFCILLLALGAVILTLLNNAKQVNMSHERRLMSHQAADEICSSSDALTRFARTYVVTGNPRYEEHYWDVIAMREGVKPRPADSDQFYWHLLTGSAAVAPEALPGSPKALLELLRGLGFTETEMAKLQEAKRLSDDLVKVEEQAMNTAKGLYPDATGKYTKQGTPDRNLALQLIYDDAYHLAKTRITSPVYDCMTAMAMRTNAELRMYERRGERLFMLAVILLGTLFSFTLGVAIVAVRKVAVPARLLQEQTELVADDLDRLSSSARMIAEGTGVGNYEVQATPLNLARNDEIGRLASTHDFMIERLEETGWYIALVTTELAKQSMLLQESNRILDERNALLEDQKHELAATNDLLHQEMQVREKAESANRRLAEIVESSEDAIIGFSLGGDVFSWNTGAEKTYGYTREEMTGNSVEILVPPDHKGEVDDFAKAILVGKAIINCETVRVRKDGSRINVLLSISPVRDSEGSTVGASVIARDITERKKAEAEREKLLDELQKALAEVKTLSGLLPICASCKKVRDDEGYWHGIEKYVTTRSDAQFSHSICPGCMKKLYSEFATDIEGSY